MKYYKDISVINDITIPNHSKEIKEANNSFNTINQSFINSVENNSITLLEFYEMYESLIGVLFFVGDLSIDVTNVRYDVETAYLKLYKHAPLLGKKLWLKKYNEIHKPYNKVKNNCFVLIEELELFFFNCNGYYPKILTDPITY